MSPAIENGFFQWNEAKMIHAIYKKDAKVSAVLWETLWKKLAKSIDDVSDDSFSKDELKRVNIMNLKGFIDDITKKIRKILEGDGSLWSEENVAKTIDRIRYFLYLRWVSHILEKKWFTADPKKSQDVPDGLASEMDNILQDIPLTSFLVFLKSLWVLETSKNVINELEVERELKILDVSKKDIESRLKAMKKPENSQVGNFKILEVKPVFEGVIVDDYYDYPDLRLDRWGKGAKSSFRIRKRKNAHDKKKSYFYTIKRKVDKETGGDDVVDHTIPRECYEKEFKIEEFTLFRDVLWEFWLRKSRSKKKKRTSYEVAYMVNWETRHIKFDIDKYKGIPTLLEIEGQNNEDIEVFKTHLALKSNKTLNGGSRELYAYYGKEDEYTKFYDVDEEKKMVIWRKEKDAFALAKKKKKLK